MRRLALVLLSLLAPGRAVGADACPVPEGGASALSNVDAARRLSFVTSSLDEASARSEAWGAFWRVTFQGAAVTQFAFAGVAHERATRIDLIAGGGKSLVGALFAYLARLPAERHARASEARAWETGDVCTRLASAEAQLARDARFEQKARGVGMHALGLSFNVGVGIAAYALHRRLWSVVSATVVGGLVGEARIWTTPTVATEAWSHYRSGRLVDAKLAWSPVIVPQPGGATLGLSGSF